MSTFCVQVGETDQDWTMIEKRESSSKVVTLYAEKRPTDTEFEVMCYF